MKKFFMIFLAVSFSVTVFSGSHYNVSTTLLQDDNTTSSNKTVSTYYGSKASSNPNNPCKIDAQICDYVNEMENNDLRIRQKPNTDRLLSDYLSPSGCIEDTIYAILYSPGECFRCEVAIPAFYKLLKQNSPNNKLLLITAYDDPKIAKWYNSKHDYKADYYLYDNYSGYDRIFSFNSEGMYGLYILKLVPAKGILITGGQYTVLGLDFVRQLVNRTERVQPYMYVLDNNDSYADVANQVASIDIPCPQWRTDDVEINTDDSFQISSIYDIPKIQNDYLFFNDMLNNGIMLYRKENGTFNFKTLFQADEKEKNKFVSVSKDHFNYLQSQGQVFYIALSANMLDSTHIGISYSLPRITEDNVGDELHFSFYNSPVILLRDVVTLQSGKMIVPDFDLEHSKYFHLHLVSISLIIVYGLAAKN